MTKTLATKINCFHVQQQLQQQPSPTIHPPLVSPIVVPALRMPNGGYEDNESEEHLKKTLLKEQTKFYATLNCFVQECRAAMPLIVNQFVAVTSPHQQPAAANAFTQVGNWSAPSSDTALRRCVRQEHS